MTTGERRPFREFGSWLRARRLARRWTQEELADRLGYDVTYVRKIEWGERKASEGFRARLAHVFELPVESLPASDARVQRTRTIPAPLTSFVGREQDVAAVTGLLVEGSRLITLLGAPGVGKTRLAIEVASHLDDLLPHGSRFVSLITVTDAASVPAAVCTALGLRTSDAEAAEKVLADHLDQQEMLLVLDNLEHVVGAAPFVARLLANAPKARVLVTSREALRVAGEVQYPVAPLPCVPTGAAVALFVERARLHRPDFTVAGDTFDAVAGVCERLDGVPLAIELAAAAARVLSPEELHRSLERVLDLPSTGPQDAPQHQQTLRATLDWSYQLLDPEHQALLARLGVFVGGFTLDAAASVCAGFGTDKADVLAGVAALVDKSLLQSRPDSLGSRFVPLETIREYALERLAEREEAEKVARSHAVWCVELAETAERHLLGKGQSRWLEVLSAEYANLVSALTRAIRAEPTQAVRLAAGLWRFWWMRGHVNEGRHRVEATLAAAPGDELPYIRAAIGAGVLARTQADYRRAEELFEEAAGKARRGGHRDELALALVNLGILRQHQGWYDTAEAVLQQSLETYRGTGNQRGVGHALNCLGSVAVSRGDEASAAVLFDQALAAFRAVEDPWSVALASANLGWVAHTRGDSRLARSWYTHSLDLCRDLGEERGVANALGNLGRVAFADGDLVGATGFIEESLLLFRRLGERRALAECLEQLGAVATRLGNRGRAARLLAAAAALRELIGAPLWPTERQAQESLLQELRDGLTRDEFEEAWAEGRRMSTEEAVTFALTRGA